MEQHNQTLYAVYGALVHDLGKILYRAGEYLSLDLSKAVLSPKRLGPPTEFAPVAVEARTDSKPVVAEPA